VGNGDALDIVVHKNIRLSNVIVSNILDSDHLPIIFHILDHVRTKNVPAPLEIFTNWERFLLVKMCLCQVSRLSRWRPIFLTGFGIEGKM
jgi:hypothetical protein